MRVLALVLTVCSFFSNITAQLFEEASRGENASTMKLVNRENKIPYDYKPESLVIPNVLPAPQKEEAIYMVPEAARALESLFSAAALDGHTLYAVSGYRSYALQKVIYERKVEAVGERAAQRAVAPPGTSEHQLGLAMDVNGETTVRLGLVTSFGETPEGQWVSQNAHRFGFIIRYPQHATDITGYSWEPWHLRYIGVDAATEIFGMGITFEEYHQVLDLRKLIP